MEIVKTKVQLYEKYKDSGVTWLGDIPEHWEVESFKNILTERNEKNEPIRSKEILSLSIDKGVTLYAEKTTNLDRFKDDFTQYKLAYKGDLVLNSMNMIVGAVGVSDYFGCVSPVYYTYHGGLDNSYTSKFYEYLFRCKTVQGVLYSLGKGLIAIDRGEGKYNTLRLKVSRDDLRSLRLPFPNLFEQTAIVTYLNRKTALIDQAIGIKQKQIELLKERLQILIKNAVTRGLNPNAKMKYSGVEWIGEIPERWEVKKLKIIASYINRGSTPDYVENSKNKVINQAIFSKGFFDSENIKFTKERSFETDSINKGKVQKNDILLASTGGGVLGKVGFIDFDNDNDNYFADSHVTIIRGSEPDFFSKYYYFILSINYDLINGVLAQGSTNQTELQRNWLRDFKFPVPTFLEQKDIVEYIEKTNIKTRTAISLKEKEIGKLKEFKSVLINSAVTGKIKVC